MGKGPTYQHGETGAEGACALETSATHLLDTELREEVFNP